VVPNYNHARYLEERLGSIGAQQRRPDRLVFLDDASDDDSWAVALPLLAALPCPVVTRRNRARVGRLLRQWQVGLDALDTDLVWIAESDDRALPGLLGALEAQLVRSPGAIFAFSDSAAIDSEGRRIAADNKAYYAALGDRVLGADTVLDTGSFLARCLCPRNLVVNVSAVLWRRSALAEALAKIGSEAESWHNAADWRVYAQACSAPGRVAYLANPLNEHRRHGATVTAATPTTQQYGEVVRMLTLLRDLLGAEPERDAALRKQLAGFRRYWQLPHGQEQAG